MDVAVDGKGDGDDDAPLCPQNLQLPNSLAKLITWTNSVRLWLILLQGNPD